MKTKFIFLITILLFFNISKSQKTVSGIVYDSEKNPIPGVQIFVEGTKITALTDIDGKFVLKNVSDSCQTAIFKIYGMETIRVKIKGKNFLEVYMNRDKKIEVIDDKTTYDDKTKLLGYAITDTKSEKHKSDKRTTAIYEDIPATTSTNINVKSGTLTAGELNDFGKWEMWKDISEKDLSTYQKKWLIYPKDRYCVLVQDQNKQPIIDATVYLLADNNIIWTAKTDNTGKAELWNSLYKENTQKDFQIKVFFNNTEKVIKKPTTFQKGINQITIETKCNISQNVDIAFVIDATGSMSDEMKYLQEELLDVFKRIDSTHKNLNLRLGTVFYRDNGDSYVTKHKDFTKDIASSIEFMKQQYAGGGGDYPEAVDSGLFVALNYLDWNPSARTRLLFLVLDAPPHENIAVKTRLQELITLSAQMGVRIIPVVCSGIDKSTEYLMRSMALATNGNYVFLTDDSGIGDKHIKPTTDKWNVEFLNDLLVRLINQYVFVPQCNQKLVAQAEQFQKDTVLINPNTTLPDTTKNQTKDTTKTNIKPIELQQALKIYPNPTAGPLTIEVLGKVKEFYICDIGGKILQRQLVEKNNIFRIDISMYPQGFYFIRYFIDERLMSGKIVLSY